MPITMPMIPVYLKISLPNPRGGETTFITIEKVEIPEPECCLEISIGGHPWVFDQSRCWKVNAMWVTLMPRIPSPSMSILDVARDITRDCQSEARWVRAS